MTGPTGRPYTRPRRRTEHYKAVVIGSVLLLGVAALLMWLVVDFASEQPDKANLPGGETFVVGDAERFARRIDEQGAPIFFKDPLTARAGREIYVLHDGDDPDEGWYAVLAYADADNRKLECALQWEIEAARFVDPCTGDTYEPGDDGLTRYPADVNDDGKVEVDLRAAS